MGLRANTHVVKTSKYRSKIGDNAFWGERIRGSLSNDGCANQLTKSLKAEKRDKKVKPGVAYAVITSNNPNEVMVSRIPSFQLSFYHY